MIVNFSERLSSLDFQNLQSYSLEIGSFHKIVHIESRSTSLHLPQRGAAGLVIRFNCRLLFEEKSPLPMPLNCRAMHGNKRVSDEVIP